MKKRYFVSILLYILAVTFFTNNSFATVSCIDVSDLKQCLHRLITDLNEKEKTIDGLKDENQKLRAQIEGIKNGSTTVARANYANEADKADKLRGSDSHHWLRINPDNAATLGQRLMLWRDYDNQWFDQVRVGNADYSDKANKLRGREGHWIRVNPKKAYDEYNRDQLMLWHDNGTLDGLWYPDLVRVSFADKAGKLRGRNDDHWIMVNPADPTDANNFDKLMLWTAPNNWHDLVHVGAALRVQ
ncbi:MAG: hypothetical protein HQK52_11755 [Oligoflexia bacterium]|nr:hypothetical protein [Oligoflexia bacterium]